MKRGLFENPYLLPGRRGVTEEGKARLQPLIQIAVDANRTLWNVRRGLVILNLAIGTAVLWFGPWFSFLDPFILFAFSAALSLMADWYLLRNFLYQRYKIPLTDIRGEGVGRLAWLHEALEMNRPNEARMIAYVCCWPPFLWG